MKQIKKSSFFALAAIAIVVLAATAAVLRYKADEASKSDLLKLKSIVKAFNAQGITLKEVSSNSEEYDMAGIKPSMYTIGNSKDSVLIYMFKSFMERDEVLSKYGGDPFSIEKVQYKAKNALIVYKPYEIPKTEDDLAAFSKTKKLIADMVFKDLNQGKEVVFKGESEHWLGTFTLKYYQHWVQDEKGLHYVGYSWEYPVLKYKLKDIDSVGAVTYKYETTGGNGSGEVDSLDKDGYVTIGSGGGNGAMHDINKDINFTVKWGDKEEHLTLKAQ